MRIINTHLNYWVEENKIHESLTSKTNKKYYIYGWVFAQPTSNAWFHQILESWFDSKRMLVLASEYTTSIIFRVFPIFLRGDFGRKNNFVFLHEKYSVFYFSLNSPFRVAPRWMGFRGTFFSPFFENRELKYALRIFFRFWKILFVVRLWLYLPPGFTRNFSKSQSLWRREALNTYISKFQSLYRREARIFPSPRARIEKESSEFFKSQRLSREGDLRIVIDSLR